MTKAKTCLALLTAVACLPYLTLKVIWLCGGRAGIPEGSPLLDGGTTLWTVNALTVAMDATVILLVLALIRPWGRRLPAAWLLLPLWCACGLLGPIVVAFPVQQLYAALSGGPGTGQASGADGSRMAASDLLDGWVWTLVYTGFLAQAVTLSALFVLHVRDRWGTLLRARLSELPLPSRGRGVRRGWFALGALAALIPAVMHAMWALGSQAGLSGTSAARSGSDSRITNAAFLFFALLAVAGAARLAGSRAEGRRGGARLWGPLAAAWAGSGTLACWGGWLLMGALSAAGKPAGQRATAAMEGVYSVQALAGLLIAGLATQVLVLRARALPAGGGQDATVTALEGTALEATAREETAPAASRV
ncbi:hypothetical protein OHB04_32955 [Streptomyces sp. NBC_01775]|uniref:hypothetical protein n=1 Tax=Streptomyces sp. NBC_01775 TaxID=2975939 RepID=UPI002DD7A1AE|nr:hypothetical protein [Streptomyces sp. NBC_01775]WSB80060.1 hypothetical protein OHB04_32955 [Streptomyces sp. NBC_01775]